MLPTLKRLCVLLLVLVGLTAPAAAQDRGAVSGRSKPVITSSSRGDRAAWAVTLGGGVFASGNLFRVINDATVRWDVPGAEAFDAERFTATLDEDAALVFGLARRLGDDGWLRLDVASGEMDLTALANDSQFVTPQLYDRLSLLAVSLSWEQRLLDTRLQPFLVGGLSWTDIKGASEALTQSKTGVRVGAGVVYRMHSWGGVRLEVADTIVSVDSAGIPEEGGHPASARFTEFGPQHLFVLSAQLELMF